eukprot:scaffold74900_cov70-Phaeocystis_antarctica.AAC.1
MTRTLTTAWRLPVMVGSVTGDARVERVVQPPLAPGHRAPRDAHRARGGVTTSDPSALRLEKEKKCDVLEHLPALRRYARDGIRHRSDLAHLSHVVDAQDVGVRDAERTRGRRAPDTLARRRAVQQLANEGLARDAEQHRVAEVIVTEAV